MTIVFTTPIAATRSAMAPMSPRVPITSSHTAMAPTGRGPMDGSPGDSSSRASDETAARPDGGCNPGFQFGNQRRAHHLSGAKMQNCQGLVYTNGCRLSPKRHAASVAQVADGEQNAIS